MPATANDFSFRAIGTVHSPYREKFAVPRQPGLVTAARAELHLHGDCNREEILRGLDGFSHVWLLFMFDQVLDQGWTPTVRPPRLGGNRRLGVFATRSPFRPNPIGLSAVRLDGVDHRDGQWLLRLSGIDLVDGTPILDIKPYVPYADAIADARGGFAEQADTRSTTVSFSADCVRRLDALEARYPALRTLIEQVIGQQPQPAYQQHVDRIYGMTLYDLNIRWRRDANRCTVLAIDPST